MWERGTLEDPDFPPSSAADGFLGEEAQEAGVSIVHSFQLLLLKREDC